MRSGVALLALVGGLSFALTAAADCMSQAPRHVEMQVESCSSAVPLARAAIEGKGYSDSQRQEALEDIQDAGKRLQVTRAGART